MDISTTLVEIANAVDMSLAQLPKLHPSLEMIVRCGEWAVSSTRRRMIPCSREEPAVIIGSGCHPGSLSPLDSICGMPWRPSRLSRRFFAGWTVRAHSHKRHWKRVVMPFRSWWFKVMVARPRVIPNYQKPWSSFFFLLSFPCSAVYFVSTGILTSLPRERQTSDRPKGTFLSPTIAKNYCARCK